MWGIRGWRWGYFSLGSWRIRFALHMRIGRTGGEKFTMSGRQTEGWKVRLKWVGRQIDLPIKVLTEKPEETGVDRIVNIAAAHEQMEKACVVVDAGTAITVDCCNDAGEFLGGAIAPGARTMLAALHEK